MERPIYYSILPSKVRYAENLSANEKILYSEIVVLAKKKGYCYATNDYFVNLYKVSKNTISRWVNNLEKQGFIRCEMMYLEDTKWITGRKIYPKTFDEKVWENSTTSIHTNGDSPIYKNNDRGIHKNDDSPIHKNDDYNNTRYNNTRMNETRRILSSFNTLGGRVKELDESEGNLAKIEKLLDMYGEESLHRAIEEIRRSKFLRGETSGFVVSLDYLMKPVNMEKVTGGNYMDFDNSEEFSYESPYHKESVDFPSQSNIEYLEKLLERI